MAAVVPSVVVQAIDEAFPFANEEQASGKFAAHATPFQQRALVEMIFGLCKQILHDLLPASGGADFVLYQKAMAVIGHEKEPSERGEKYSVL